MDMWTFIAIAVLASVGLSAYKARLRHQRRRLDEEYCARDEDIDDLMDRVATLESIVTDKKSRLKDEINNL